MSNTEKVELICIPLFGLVIWVIAPLLPGKAGVGGLVLGCGALILLQSLVRDIWLLSQMYKRSASETGRTSRSVCLESVAGVSVIVMGLLVMAFSAWNPVEMSRSCWSLTVMVVMVTGFVVKDYVMDMDPFRIRKYKNHMNIIVRWKKE